MPKQEHINIFAQGKDAWNAWVNSDAGEPVDFENWNIKRDLDFEGFEFPLGINISGADIRGSVSFKGCHFAGTANFQRSKFREIDLSSTVFSSKADFSHLLSNGVLNVEQATFEDEVSFHSFNVERAVFAHLKCQSAVRFDHIDARNGCDFSNAEFDLAPVFPPLIGRVCSGYGPAGTGLQTPAA